MLGLVWSAAARPAKGASSNAAISVVVCFMVLSLAFTGGLTEIINEDEDDIRWLRQRGQVHQQRNCNDDEFVHWEARFDFKYLIFFNGFALLARIQAIKMFSEYPGFNSVSSLN